MTTAPRIAMAAALAAVTLPAQQAWALDDVVVSIKPLHSLVAGVMRGVGEPHLIVTGAASPHTYAMRPSDAAAIEDASLVFWAGPDLETFMERPLAALGGDAAVVELGARSALELLPFREGGPFEAHGHAHGDGDRDNDGHDEEGHDDHDHAGHDDHDHDEDHAHHEDGDEEAGDDHAHGHTGGFDMHFWLDPVNAAAVVGTIEAALAKADPGNAETYAANADALRARLDELVSEVEAEVEPLRGRSFIVFHDAYQYFEKRFDIPAAGSITVSPEVMPGAERLSGIRDRIAGLDAACVFAEPQFEPRLVEIVIEGTGAKAGVLDPEGGSLEEGPELYFDLIRNLAASLADCLGAKD